MRKICLICLVVFTLFAGIAAADITDYADYLLEQKRYPAAVLEYERYLYHHAQTESDSLYAHMAMVRAYYGAGMYDEVWEFGNQQSLLTKSPEFQRRFLSLSHLRQGNYDAARLIPELAHGANSILLKGIAELYLGNSNTAQSLFHSLPDDAFSSTAWDKTALLQICQQSQRLPQKSPWLAGTLALIPGAGYAYNHKWQTAISSLLLHSIFAATAYELHSKDLPISSALVATVGLGYYIGNIYGSISESLKYNQRHRTQYLGTHLQPFIQYLEDDLPFLNEPRER
ncbi:MAG: hypothetical protein GX294_00765 [Candidatus Cloacimonetes bacterium]|nr:hypothetical protein [Candidatus Cloacimonadota bacterium]